MSFDLAVETDTYRERAMSRMRRVGALGCFPPGLLNVVCAYLTYVPIRTYGVLYLKTILITNSDAVVDPFYACLSWSVIPRYRKDVELSVRLKCKAGFTVKGAAHVRVCVEGEPEYKGLETDGIETFDLGGVIENNRTIMNGSAQCIPKNGALQSRSKYRISWPQCLPRTCDLRHYINERAFSFLFSPVHYAIIHYTLT
jgi:hypothetical protein